MIGIMGGTFNPIHFGHLLLCEHIREEQNLDKILFIPAQQPPHKDPNCLADGQKRLEMTIMATQSNSFFEVSDIEMKRSGASYTVDTLKKLKEQYGSDTGLALIIGADSLVQITSWRNYKEIISLCRIIVARRPDTLEYHLERAVEELRLDYRSDIKISDAIAYDFSSTEIRNRVKRGLSIKYMVPEKVESYITDNRLYK